MSQTIFVNVATLPKGSRADDSVTTKLPIHAAGRVCARRRSGAWTTTRTAGRNRRAWRAARSCAEAGAVPHRRRPAPGHARFSTASTTFRNDAACAICVPSVANILAAPLVSADAEGRTAKPGAPRNTGEYLDGFGNKMTVAGGVEPVQATASQPADSQRTARRATASSRSTAPTRTIDVRQRCRCRAEACSRARQPSALSRAQR